MHIYNQETFCPSPSQNKRGSFAKIIKSSEIFYLNFLKLINSPILTLTILLISYSLQTNISIVKICLLHQIDYRMVLIVNLQI